MICNLDSNKLLGGCQFRMKVDQSLFRNGIVDRNVDLVELFIANGFEMVDFQVSMLKAVSLKFR